jgi:hypothetical protein
MGMNYVLFIKEYKIPSDWYLTRLILPMYRHTHIRKELRHEVPLKLIEFPSRVYNIGPRNYKHMHRNFHVVKKKRVNPPHV